MKQNLNLVFLDHLFDIEEEDQGTDEEEEELADIGMEYLINPEKVAEEPKPSKKVSRFYLCVACNRSSNSIHYI